jgi:hypothetical protein
MLLLMWTQSNISEVKRCLFGYRFRKGRPLLQLPKGIVSKQGRPLLCKNKNMNFLDTISLSNSGMASTGELILFFGLIALMIFDEIISKNK